MTLQETHHLNVYASMISSEERSLSTASLPHQSCFYHPSTGGQTLTAGGSPELWQLAESVLLLPGHGLQGYDNYRALRVVHHVSGQAATSEGLLESVGC